MPSPRLILASASPRRVELLRAAGFAFDVDPADIDEETGVAHLSPRDLAASLALAKAAHVAGRHERAVILGADTVVGIGDERFGKAETPDAARAMLRAQMGRRQSVFTGVAIVPSHDRGGRTLHEVVESVVEMRPMTDAELDAYIATDEWRGKAGAYGIQDGRDDPFVRLISGPFSNVVGLPIERVTELLASLGVLPQSGVSR